MMKKLIVAFFFLFTLSISYAQLGPMNGSDSAVISDSGSIHLFYIWTLDKTIEVDFSADKNFFSTKNKTNDQLINKT